MRSVVFDDFKAASLFYFKLLLFCTCVAIYTFFYVCIQVNTALYSFVYSYISISIFFTLLQEQTIIVEQQIYLPFKT